MASVNYVKIKSKQQAKAYFAHCDKDMRLDTEYHQNEHIDKSMTYKNRQLKGRDYKSTCKKFDDRIAYLDSLPNANTRKDRVLLFGLDIPCPADMQEDDLKSWFGDVLEIIGDMYGKDNIMNMYVHSDEIHEYINSHTREKTTSRTHGHFYIIPEHDGKLNGRWFSSRANMIKLNNSIQQMTESKYHMKFMDGSQKKSKDTVEALKRQSELLELEKAINDKQIQLNALEEQIRVCIDDVRQYDEEKAEQMAKRHRKRMENVNICTPTVLNDENELTEERSDEDYS